MRVQATVFLTACSGTPTVHLAAFDAAEVTLDTGAHESTVIDGFDRPGISITFDGPHPIVSDPGDCPVFAPDVTATYDGLAMAITQQGGAYGLDPGWRCKEFVFELGEAPARPGQTSQVLIADPTAMWTIEATDLMTNDLTIATPTAGHATVTWPSASMLSVAHVEFHSTAGEVFYTNDAPRALTFSNSGNVVDVAFPSGFSGGGTLSIDLFRVPTASRCDGPLTCELRVDVTRDFQTTIP